MVGSAGKSLEELAAGFLRGVGVEFRSLSVLALDRSSPVQVVGILLCFPDGLAEPTHVIKLTTDAGRARGLANEYAHLSHLGASADPLLTAGLPRAVHFGEVDAWHVLVETALPGRRMKDYPSDTYFASRRFEGHLSRVSSWLSAFERCCKPAGGVGCVGDPVARVAATVARYRDGFRCSPAVDELLRRTVDRLEPREPAATHVHGDFCTANVLVRADGAIAVIDWEYARRDGFPLTDLLHFLTSLWTVPYAKGRDRLLANYRRLFFESHVLLPTLRREVQGLVAALGLAGEDLLPLSAMAWIELANLTRARLAPGGAAPFDPSSDPWPLVMLEDGHCLNLELLAERQEHYWLAGLGPPSRP